MSKESPAKPTTAELSILRVLWRRGPSTVREVHEVLDRERPVVYTTVLKMLQIMADKGLVTREDSARAHIFRPLVSEEGEQRRLVGDLVDRVFDGSAKKLVMQALSNHRATPEEIGEIRRLLDTLEGERE